MPSSAFQPNHAESRSSRSVTGHTGHACEESLPFTVEIVRSQEDLRKAVQIRHSAYARHLPQFAETLKTPEAADVEQGAVVLLAKSKLDGSPLGTMRIQTNEFNPLCLEQSVILPGWLAKQKLAEATRLGVADGKGGRLVTHVLFKSFYLYCHGMGIEWMVIAGRAPIDRQYERLLFTDVFPGIGYIPLIHGHRLLHRIMSFNVQTARTHWEKSRHPLLQFMCETQHPDIQLNATRQARTVHDRRVSTALRYLAERRRHPERRSLCQHTTVKHSNPETHNPQD